MALPIDSVTVRFRVRQADGSLGDLDLVVHPPNLRVACRMDELGLFKDPAHTVRDFVTVFGLLLSRTDPVHGSFDWLMDNLEGDDFKSVVDVVTRLMGLKGREAKDDPNAQGPRPLTGG